MGCWCLRWKESPSPPLLGYMVHGYGDGLARLSYSEVRDRAQLGELLFVEMLACIPSSAPGPPGCSRAHCGSFSKLGNLEPGP